MDHYYGTICYAVHDGNGFCAYFVDETDAQDFIDIQDDSKYTIHKVAKEAKDI